MAQFTPLSTFEFTSPTHTNCIKSWITCVCATPLHLHCVIMKMLVCAGGGFQVSPSHLRSGHVSTESFGNLKTTSHPSQISATNPTGSIPLPSVSFTLPQKTMHWCRQKFPIASLQAEEKYTNHKYKCHVIRAHTHTLVG